MTYYCSECVVNWHPFQCDAGACPKCGGGTVRRQQHPSAEANDLFASIKARRDSELKHDLFEKFYQEREKRLAGEGA